MAHHHVVRHVTHVNHIAQTQYVRPNKGIFC